MQINLHVTKNTFYTTKYFQFIATEPLNTAKYTTKDGLLQSVMKFSEEATASDEDGN